MKLILQLLGGHYFLGIIMMRINLSVSLIMCGDKPWDCFYIYLQTSRCLELFMHIIHFMLTKSFVCVGLIGNIVNAELIFYLLMWLRCF